VVVHFPNIDRRKIRREEIPSHCGRGHPLTPDNLRIEGGEQRWRCLHCGRERAAASKLCRRRTKVPFRRDRRRADNGAGFEMLFRFYGPEKALFDKTWMLRDIEQIT
jgi:hypothetical protein